MRARVVLIRPKWSPARQQDQVLPQPVVDGVADGMIAFYGTYTVNDGVLTTRIEGSSYPNLIGGEQKRIR